MRDLKEKIDQVRTMVFPKSCTRFRDAVLGKDTIFVNVFLGAHENEMPHRIFHNDPLSVRFVISEINVGQYSVEPTASITGLFPDSPHMVYSSRKIRTRRFTGDESKVLSGIQNVLERVKQELVQISDQGLMKCELPYQLSEKLTVAQDANT